MTTIYLVYDDIDENGTVQIHKAFKERTDAIKYIEGKIIDHINKVERI